MAAETPSILILEDELPLLEMITDFLQSENMRPIPTSQPDQALQRLEQVDPDLIIIDVMLSGASGIEVAVRLRERGMSDTPIIAISASSLMLDFARQMGAFNAYIAKPFDLDDLLQCMQSLMESDDSRGSR